MENKTITFKYTYSAPQNQEAKRIRQKYILYMGDRMERLRRLDKSVATPGKIAGYLIGSIGSACLCTGLICVLIWPFYIQFAVAVGLLGAAGIVLAYPVYSRLTEKRRRMLAPQILELCNELIQP